MEGIKLKNDDKLDVTELYEKIIIPLNKNPNRLDLYEKTQWIHLVDAVSRRTITKMEAYDCIKIGYVPDYLSTRYSLYCHLL